MNGRKRLQQAALFARFGVPRQVRPDATDEDGTATVRVYVVPSREAADAFAAADRETWGNRARVELRESLGWCVVVDLRAVVAAHRAAHPLPRIRG